MMRRPVECAWKPAAALLAALTLAGSSHAADLYTGGQWSALASDRLADRVGDSLTVIIMESASATNTAQTGSKKAVKLAGQASADTSFSHSAQAQLNGASDGSGQTGRADRMTAQISVVVDDVLPNGDLHVIGQQILNINGERTKIRVKGRVRRVDISSANTVLSTRLADAAIDYDGRGFVTRSGKPGIVTRILNRLGLM